MILKRQMVAFIEITPINEDTEDYSDMDSVEAEIDDIVAGFDEIPHLR